MPRYRGQSNIKDASGFTASDFYTYSKSSLAPSRQASAYPGSAQSSGRSSSGYATPELEAAARPYADVGKVNLNLFDPLPDTALPQQMDRPVVAPPTQPNAQGLMQTFQLPWMDKEKGESLAGVPGAGVIGGGIDFLANIGGSIPQIATGPAVEFYDRLGKTPDDQLSDVERQVKSLNQGLFAAPPDSPVMQGKQMAEVYKQFLIAEAHAKGSSAQLMQPQMTIGPLDTTPIGGALKAYGDLANLMRRGLGSAPWADQINELKNPEATEELIGEERWAIREALLAGEINDEEARDMLALSSFALMNPDPIKLDNAFGPVDTIANAALALAGEIATDPLSIPATLATGGAWLAKSSVQATLRSVTRSVARQAVADAGQDIATAAGRELYQTTIEQVTKEATELAAQNVGSTAATRWMPKAATVAAKQTGKVTAEGIKEYDILEAMLSLGAQNTPRSAAITRGLNDAGRMGFIATKTTPIVKAGQAIDKMVDPFSLFGYWRTGRVVPVAMSKQAATGAYDAIGWRVSRRLQDSYVTAGVDPEAVSRARGIAFANHTVQAGDNANTRRMVAANSAFTSGMTPTEAALQHAGRRPGDIRRLVRDQVDKTLEFIVPAKQGGRATAMAEWRERAVRQLMDFGAAEPAARAAASVMDERQMRALANDHYGLAIETLDEVKRAAAPTGKWTSDGINRVTFMGPRQMSTQQAEAVAKAVAEGKASVVRAAVRRFRDLNENVSESLDDAELLAEVGRLLPQIDKSLPTAIEDLTDLPTGLIDWAKAHPGYQLMLRPDDNNLLVPIRNADGRITGVKSWIDNVTERTPHMEVTRAKAWREGLLRGISGGEVERNAARRFIANMAEWAGMSEAESVVILRAIRKAATDSGAGSPRGMTTGSILAAVDATKLEPSRRGIASRSVVDALFDAYENEARLVGMTPKATGFVKKHASGLGSNALGWVTDYLYPVVRFGKNPLFVLQELPEAAFFLALMGRYPVSNLVPDALADALQRANIPYGGRKIAEWKNRTKLYNDKTMIVMDRMSRMSPNAEYDQYEIAELIRMGLTTAAQLTDPRTPLGKLLQKTGTNTPLDRRKRRSVALATRYELGEQWRRSLMKNTPEQWLATRAFYPDEMSDGEVAVQWMLDLMARSDPDSIYSSNVPGLFNPSHIGRRAEVSDHLIRRFVYGEADMANHTWDSMVGDIEKGTLSVDHVRRDLMNAGADPDYVNRAVTRLTFGTPEQFYKAANDLGISEATTDAWAASNRVAASLQGISEGEYIARNFVGRPLHTDQMGNIVGETLFDDIVESMRTRGKTIPAPDSQETADLMRVSNEMITGVFPTGGVPAQMPKGTPTDTRKAANKVRGWENARADREANPSIGTPPSREAPARAGADTAKGQPVKGYTIAFEEDPFLDYYDRSGPRSSEFREVSDTNVRIVQVMDENDPTKAIGFVYVELDPATRTMQVKQSQVLDPHGRKGIGNWMYRTMEERTGYTFVQTADQSDTARALWAQPDRPFGPQTRTPREYQTAINNGTATVAPPQPVAVASLPESKLPAEEYWPYDIETFSDPTLSKMKPIRVTEDGRFVDNDSAVRAAVARKEGIDTVQVETVTFPPRTMPFEPMGDFAARQAAQVGMPLYQTELHTIGQVTPAQYLRQIETMMDPEAMARRGLRAMTEKDALNAIEWYDHIRRSMFALVDENLTGEERIQEAARILIAFGTTQLNTSPADGFRHVFKAYGMRARGETLQLDEARNIVQQAVGLNPEQLNTLIWGRGNKIDQMGIAQKLFDFIDSLTGSKKRTNGITGPRGDWGPVAVDIHTKRDFGFLDPAMGTWVYRLVERETPDGLVHGVSSKFVRESGDVVTIDGEKVDQRIGHFVIEMSDGTTEVIGSENIGLGVPTNHEYDYGVELANDIRDHFNEIGFMGREWSSYEVQALGWYRMQLLKSPEGDAGTVANAVFEQSRWMGSNDLVPSVSAPLHEVFPWDAVEPQYHRSIHIEGARHASDEAEMASGAMVLTKMDSDAVVGGTYRPAQTVELTTDPTGAEQYLAHYLLLSEQDSGVLMRDYTGATRTPRYSEGVGISVDIPARDEEHAKELLQLLAAEDGSPLRAIGSHTFIARASDGSLHLRTLWEPTGKAGRNEFNRALKDTNIVAKIEEASPGTVAHDTLVDFVRLSHDWKADPTGKTYMDVIQRGSGKHGVMRSPEQRAALIEQYDGAYEAAQAALAKANRMRANNPAKPDAVKAAKKAVAVAKKEMEVARAAPAGRSSSDVSELVGSARVRVRETVRSGFDRYAAREVRNERERVLGEARDAAAGSLGTDPLWDDVLALATGSNGERLFERTPGGTVRAAVTRSGANDQRAQLYLNRGVARDTSLLHELMHVNAWEMDDSAVRAIKGVFAGLEGTPYGTHTPGTPLTEQEHEWLISQFMLWVGDENSVHPVLAPLMKHFKTKLDSTKSLKTQATAPSREAVKRIDGEIAALQVKLGKAKSLRTKEKISRDIAEKMVARNNAVREGKAIRSQGGLSPEVKRVLDEIGAKAGERKETRASTFNADEANMLEWAQISLAASQRRANDLVHMRGERSALERSINHPFLMMYPTSYMYGKVLPYMAEFLLARPFGMKAPFVAYTVGQSMHQSFQRQQQYDTELRDYLYKNEPFLRAMSLFVPGLPWDLPSGFPFWARRVMENWMTNHQRRLEGRPEEQIDIPGIIANSAMYNLTLRGPDSWGPVVDSFGKVPEIAGSIFSGEAPQPEAPKPVQP